MSVPLSNKIYFISLFFRILTKPSKTPLLFSFDTCKAFGPAWIIQSAFLIHTDLNIYYSIFHKNQPNKPTLVYDLIEEFRDREIISILNHGRKLKKSNYLLSEETTKIIVQNIQKRLATPTNSR